MADLRRKRIVLVAHSLLSDLPGAPATGPAQRTRILAWADGLAAGIYQLPPPGHQLVPGVDPRARRALSRGDGADLGFVFDQLAVYQGDDYELLGVLVGPHDLVGRAGQGWWRRVQEAAASHGIGRGKKWIITDGATPVSEALA